MPPRRLLIIGNSGSGKSTMARRLAAQWRLPVLPLDSVAWAEGAQRRPLADSRRDLLQFIHDHTGWIMEGCYGSLAETALPHCTELRFLNPGVDVCVANCRARPWEPEKFATPAEQDAMRDALIDWVQQYEKRDDEFGLAHHRAIYDAFTGTKHEYTVLPPVERVASRG